jgi:hypothetical protein
MALVDTAIVDPILKGDHEEIEFTLYKPDGTARNLTNYEVRFGAKFDLSDAVVRMPKSSVLATEIEITDVSGGKGKIYLERDDTDFVTYETTLIAALTAIDNLGRRATTRFRIPVEIGVVDE